VTAPQISTSVGGNPTPEEAAAIVAAIDALWPRAAASHDVEPRRSGVWKFSGRWWTQPIPLRRARPWT
jgi:hypothetical protein